MLAREMKPGYRRTHVKCCKLVVRDANNLGNIILCILTSKNQIYSPWNFITEIEFTVSRLRLPNAVFGLTSNPKMSYLN